ncbi:SGNH/GDSL hydrolase family protein [Paenibacillus allorhizosphaerae]|uniref:SGNH hydrolase-type esterase domain-containing protein n=1 Tax=Paenibacillus allorhizosphaerae TaxID=2849866 RepID=A0ABM8VBB0_9BACL|nr:SGNH/GDSL hydrolase family protein [Paenibacillus allorhizosphaerae]CAG7618926.1 hypothetical protein PAECIP111802_00567 [Paenibacillus allorhizosphaerae]
MNDQASAKAGKTEAACIYSSKEAWDAALNVNQKDRPEFQYVELDPSLEHVLLIGDSISMGYTIPVRQALAGKANVCRIPVNGGDSARGLQWLDKWLGSKKWRIIHFNWGLHDLKYLQDGALDLAGRLVSTPEQYEQHLRTLATRLQQTGARLIWASTTPVPEGAVGRVPGSELTYNDRAAKVMNELGIAVNDLHGHVADRLDGNQLPRNVHFTDEGYALLGAKVTELIEQQLQTDQ